MTQTVQSKLFTASLMFGLPFKTSSQELGLGITEVRMSFVGFICRSYIHSRELYLFQTMGYWTEQLDKKNDNTCNISYWSYAKSYRAPVKKQPVGYEFGSNFVNAEAATPFPL